MTKLQSPQGELMALDKALALEDGRGEPIEWKEIEGSPGSYTAVVEQKGWTDKKTNNKKLPGHTYTYTISPYSPTGKPIVQASMVKETVKSKEEAIEEAEAGEGPVVQEKESSSSSFESEDTGKRGRNKKY